MRENHDSPVATPHPALHRASPLPATRPPSRPPFQPPPHCLTCSEKVVGSCYCAHMSVFGGESRKWWTLVLLCLMGVGMAAQVVPFVVCRVSGHQHVAGVTLPADGPVEYTTTDQVNAYSLNQAQIFGDLAPTLTVLCGLLSLLLSRIPDRIGAVLTPRTRIWLIRVAFLAAVFLLLRTVRLPFLYFRFRLHEAVGLTPMTALEWMRVLLIGLSIPLMLFVLKYLLVICAIPIFQRHWWLAAAVGVFLIIQVIPEVVSRTYRLDLVETMRPLEAGPHYDAMQAVLKTVGRALPIMEVDHSRRSNTANIYLAGRPGREYVVVTDTLVRQYSPREAALSLAHELGHLERRMPALFIEKSWALLMLLLTFGLARLVSGRKLPQISTALRMAALVMLCSILVSFAFSPVTSAISRAEERIADRYALRLTGDREGFKQLLVKQAKHDLEMLEPPGWQYWLFATHPTVLERIAVANGK